VSAPTHPSSNPLVDRLWQASVAGCSCVTKTPEIKFHDELCHYRLHMECVQALQERAADEPKKELDEHDAGIIKDLEAMAANQLAGFWPQVLAIGALRLIRREHSPGEVANSQKPSAAVDGIHQHRLSKPETLGVVDQPPGECSVSPPREGYSQAYADQMRTALLRIAGWREIDRNSLGERLREIEEIALAALMPTVTKSEGLT
jgi:hypothetical protein